MSKHDLHKMMGLDVYLSSLSNDAYHHVAPGLQPIGHTHSPLVSWDVFSQAYKKQLLALSKTKDYEAVNRLSKKFGWKNPLDSLNLMDTTYEAIVVTDSEQRIVWVNPGFKAMTGYPVKHALGKSPGFLQGKNTSATTRAQIKEAVVNGKGICASLINYRKNGEEYLCEVSIHPIYNKQNNLTHFIALEREVA